MPAFENKQYSSKCQLHFKIKMLTELVIKAGDVMKIKVCHECKMSVTDMEVVRL